MHPDFVSDIKQHVQQTGQSNEIADSLSGAADFLDSARFSEPIQQYFDGGGVERIGSAIGYAKCMDVCSDTLRLGASCDLSKPQSDEITAAMCLYFDCLQNRSVVERERSIHDFELLYATLALSTWYLESGRKKFATGTHLLAVTHIAWEYECECGLHGLSEALTEVLSGSHRDGMSDLVHLVESSLRNQALVLYASRLWYRAIS